MLDMSADGAHIENLVLHDDLALSDATVIFEKKGIDISQIIVSADLIPEVEGGYTVYCPELDIYTQGDTEEECLANLREAAELHLEEVGGQATIPKVIRREVTIEAVG